jgi:hypothetical protein
MPLALARIIMFASRIREQRVGDAARPSGVTATSAAALGSPGGHAGRRHRAVTGSVPREQISCADPTDIRRPRYKRSDDATVAFCLLGS